MVKIRLTRPPSGRSGGPRFIPAGRLMICEWPKETAPALGGQLGPLWAEMCRWGDRLPVGGPARFRCGFAIRRRQ